jgi:DNA-binding beta-propeller fold protein YncE
MLFFLHDNLDNIRPNSIKLSSQPRGVASSLSTDKVVVVCHKGITVFTKQKQTANLSTNFEATCVAVSPDGNLAAVGSQVHLLFITMFYWCYFRIVKYEYTQ